MPNVMNVQRFSFLSLRCERCVVAVANDICTISPNYYDVHFLQISECFTNDETAKLCKSGRKTNAKTQIKTKIVQIIRMTNFHFHSFKWFEFCLGYVHYGQTFDLFENKTSRKKCIRNNMRNNNFSVQKTQMISLMNISYFVAFNGSTHSASELITLKYWW